MRVAILTSLPDLGPQLSVCRVVTDQVRMLAVAGHEPVLYVKDGFDQRYGTLPCIAEKRLPGYMVRKGEKPAVRHGLCRTEFVKRFGDGELAGYDAIVTHDLYFLDSHQGYRSGIREIHRTTRATWFHWSHSVPRPLAGDPTGIPGHTYLALNQEDVPHVASMFKVRLAQVEVCPNPADVTDVISEPTASLVNELDLLNCDFLGVLPFSIGRLDQKGIHRAVEYYAGIARRGFRVKVLLCACRVDVAWARFEEWEESFRQQTAGTTCEVLWTPRVRPQWATVTPNRVVRELMGLSNLMIWPTIGEASSLTIAEAKVSGGPFLVLPESRVRGMREVVDEDVLLVYWQEGFWREKKWRDGQDVADEILRCDLDRFRRRLRRQWEWSRRGIWERHLKPLLERRRSGSW